MINTCEEKDIIARRCLSVIDIVISTRAFFFRFPDRLIKLFEVKYSFLDKLTTFTDMLILARLKYRKICRVEIYLAKLRVVCHLETLCFCPI